jgi:hypothetical protein
VLELVGERSDSWFILVWALDRDRVITLHPVGVSLCIGLIVFYHLFLQGLDLRSIPIVSCLDLGSSALLYIIQEARVLVGYNKEVLVGLQGSNATRITWEES